MDPGLQNSKLSSLSFTGDAEGNWGAALSTMFTHSLTKYFTEHLLCTRTGDSVANKTGKNLYTQESYNLTGREI